MVVYFIRHGETDFNKRCLIQGMSDIPLNDKGIHQAELAADWFKQQVLSSMRFFQVRWCGQEKQRQCIRQNFEEVHPDEEFRRWTLAWMKESLTR